MILIDTPSNGWSHLVGSSILELHAFAEKIGLKKCWFRSKRGKNQPHYDVRDGEIRYRAIAAGAKQVTRKQLFIYLEFNYEKIK